jgi:hypothetical protein
MNLPEPQSVTFSSLFAEIDNGTIKIPQFQRDFVWSKAQSAKLLDSIVKGYPIGTFILWKTNERLRSVRNLGGVALPDTPDGDYVKYVLDGQQRLTSLFATLRGLTVTREEHEEDFSAMYVDLAAPEDADLVVLEKDGRDESTLIRLQDLLAGEFDYLASFPKDMQSNIKRYKNRIESYQFSAVLIKDAAIDVATEIFTRLNIGGKALSVFEIMVAKTFDAERNFDLAEKYDALKADLGSVNYDTLSEAVVLQTLSVLVKKDIRKKVILKLSRTEVVDAWPRVVEAIKHSVDYFRGYYRIPVSSLLPYAALVIPFSYYFDKRGKKPDGDQKKRMEDLFWRVSLGGRYSQSLESRMLQDIEKVDAILQDKPFRYEWAVDVSPDFIRENGYFSASRSFVKALLCILAHKQPLSFEDNALVILDNAWLKQANSRNYHHFFPKAWLKKQERDDYWINHIANITLVDDYLNKQVIRAKSPGQYMKPFVRANPDIDRCMASHLIRLNERFGVMENDYDRFFRERCKAFSGELRKRIIAQEIDAEAAARCAEETESEEPEWVTT